MNQETPPGDMLFGAFVLVIFLAFVFVFGFLLYRFKNRRFTQAWAPLVPLLNGKVTGDGGGGATSWLSGTYRGQPVRAAMIPNRNRYSGEQCGGKRGVSHVLQGFLSRVGVGGPP